MFLSEPVEYFYRLDSTQKRTMDELENQVPQISTFLLRLKIPFRHPMGLVGESNHPELFNPLWLSNFGGVERFREAQLPEDFFALGTLEGAKRIFFAFWVDRGVHYHKRMRVIRHNRWVSIDGIPFCQHLKRTPFHIKLSL